MKKETKKLPYIDYACQIRDRVWWKNMAGERFEGVLIDWDNETAIIKMDDGTEKAIDC